MSTSPSLLYANDTYVNSLIETETTQQSAINRLASNQSSSMDNYNSSLFYNLNISNATATQLAEEENKYKNIYSFGVYNFLPFMDISANSAHVGCKAPLENATSNNTNMTKLDNGAYHTFNTCSNKAAVLDKKYFSIVKPLPAAGVTNPNLYECWVGNDPLTNDSGNNYYEYKTLWAMGPGVTVLGIDSVAGDIIITANDINNLGVTQKKYSTETVTYNYANGAYLPPDTFVPIDTYIFDLNQVNIVGGNINGGLVKKDVPISMVTYVEGKNNEVIVSTMDGPYIRMIKLQMAIGDGRTPGIPFDKSLYIKALEAKYAGSGGAYRFVRITAGCRGDDWLQISHIEVFDNNNVNIARGKPVTDSDKGGYWWTNPQRIVEGEPTIKGYPNVYHSGQPCRASITVDLQIDSPISKIVVYNRADCCKDRLNGAKLECIDVTGKVLYGAQLTGNDVQTFSPPRIAINNTTNINELWNRSNTVSLVGTGNAEGMGINSLVVKVTPYAAAKGNDAYNVKPNSTLSPNTNGYKTINDITVDQCRKVCDDDNRCYGYTTTGSVAKQIEEGTTDLGCYQDQGNRAMPNRFPNGNQETCLAHAQKNGYTYYGLQYGGECWATNDPTIINGMKKYGVENRQPCYTLGGAWQNHIFQRNYTNKTTTTCNLYEASMVTASSAQDNSTVASRKITTMPVNNSTLNLTNNEMRQGLNFCNSSCNVYLELGTDGNLKLYKQQSAATGTVSSSSTGQVLWDLFSYSPDVARKIGEIVPITELNWKAQAAQVTNGSNILTKGKSLPTDQAYLISTNGQFKLEVVNGYIKLKTAVYGCFSSDSTYRNTTAPMYTKTVTSGAQPFYVYQSDLTHPKIGKPYYTIIKDNPGNPRKLSMRNIEGTAILRSSNNFDDISYLGSYMPFNDTGSTKNVTSENDCMSECIKAENCNYVYTKGNECNLGNSKLPAFVPNPSTNKYKLFIRKPEINTQMPPGVSFSDIKLNRTMQILPSSQRGNLDNVISGPAISNLSEGNPPFSTVGYLGTPIGRAIAERTKQIAGGNTPLNRGQPPPQAPVAKADPPYDDAPDPTVYNEKTVRGSVTKAFEGFDTHGWKPPGQNCGLSGTDQCYPGILYGQINPLKSISKDYSAKLNQINSNYLDISNNISKYKNVYNTVNSDSKYDFTGNQQIVLNGPTDLLTEMKNDSKQLALQTNNMYIAGSILTTTLLISAIYLGRS